jgi:hypothetical protein
MDIQVSEFEEAYSNSLYSLAEPVLSFALGLQNVETALLQPNKKTGMNLHI